MFCDIREKTGNVGDWRKVIFLVEEIGNLLVVFTADHQRMASSAFIIKKGKHIDVYF